MSLPIVDTVNEAERLMVICNACRYCEGHCAVFQAMELRTAFSPPDLRYLANLCHQCGSCFHHCQYAPSHDFDVNVPKVFAQLRRETYERHVWPAFLAPVFARNGVATALVTALSSILFVVGGVLLGPDRWTAHLGAGAFYEIVPHGVVAALFGAAAAWTAVALTVACRRFRRESGDARSARAHARAGADAATLKYLDGGGEGCTYPGEKPAMGRRWFHHLTFYGFGLCFAATCVAAAYEALGRPSPFPVLSAPVLLGIAGGAGMTVGTIGLLVLKGRADRTPYPRSAMDVSFLVVLLLTAVSGFAVLCLRTTAAMGPALLLHLGVVMAFFLTAPYGKFVHGLYRYLALVRWAAERDRPAAAADADPSRRAA